MKTNGAMRILLIAYQLGGTASGIMSWRVAKALENKGCELCILTEHNHIGDVGGMKVVELPHIFSKTSLFHRIYWKLNKRHRETRIDYFWCFRAYLRCRFIMTRWKPDWIYCRSSPLEANIVGNWLANTGYKVLQHLSDPRPAPRPFDEQRTPDSYYTFLSIVRPILRSASKVSLGNEAMLNFQKECTGLDLGKKSFVSPDPTPFEGVKFYPRIPQGELHLVCFGNVRDAFRNPIPLFDAVLKMNEREIPCRLDIYNGTEWAGEELSSKYQKYVFYRGRNGQMDEAFSSASVLVDLNPDRIPSVFVSSKLKDYLCSNVPILCITPEGSPSERLLTGLRTVHIVRNTVEEIQEALIACGRFNDFGQDDYCERNRVISRVSPGAVAEELISQLGCECQD